MRKLDSHQSGGPIVSLEMFAGIVGAPNQQGAKNDCVEEYWQLADGRALRLNVTINHVDPIYSSGGVVVRERTGWECVCGLRGVDMGDDKHAACERLRRLAAVILGEPLA
jgi:hypothetical protein